MNAFGPEDRMRALAFVVGEYNKLRRGGIGRTLLQKYCYFLREAGVDLPYSFEILHYGPFCQQIYTDVDWLVVRKAIHDRSEDPQYSRYQLTAAGQPLANSFARKYPQAAATVRSIVDWFHKLDAKSMEMVATLHYLYKSAATFGRGKPSEAEVMDLFLAMKGERFSRPGVERAFRVLKKAGVFEVGT